MNAAMNPVSMLIARYRCVALCATTSRLIDIATKTSPAKAAAPPPVTRKKSCHSAGLLDVRRDHRPRRTTVIAASAYGADVTTVSQYMLTAENEPGYPPPRGGRVWTATATGVLCPGYPRSPSRGVVARIGRPDQVPTIACNVKKHRDPSVWFGAGSVNELDTN